MERLKAVNQWLTLVANVSVIAGIVFLAIELQQNTQAIQGQTRDSITDKQMVYLGWRATSPSLANVLATVDSMGVSSLSRAEREQWVGWVGGNLREWENSYSQYESGLFTDDEFAARRQRWVEQLTTSGKSEAFRQFWEATRHSFAPTFREEVDRIVSATE